jgi:monoterpene epsilon-lactone hydrolase
MTGRDTTKNATIYHDEHFRDRAAMLAMRAMLALQPGPDLSPSGRPAFDELMGKTPGAEGIAYESATVGGVPGWWCRPNGSVSHAAILYLHGGAYVVGSAQAYCNFVGQIAVRANAPIFVADYALAPERIFPAAIDDVDAVYHALSDAGFAKLAVAGDSAGGGLALVVATRMTQAARTGAGAAPVAVAAMSPWTDLALASQSLTTRANLDPVLTRRSLDGARQYYLGQADPTDHRASPLYGAVAGLPPILLHVGEDEILLDDACRFADHLKRAGTPYELHVWKGMVHVFPANLALLQAAREALEDIGQFLRRHICS